MKAAIMVLMMLLFIPAAFAAVTVEDQEVSVGKLTVVSGTIYDAEGNRVGAGHPVRVYCENANGVHQLIDGNLQTSAQGMYSAWTFNPMGSPVCQAGDEAWVEVDYQGATYTSDRVTLRSGGRADFAGVDATVPEYTTITFVAAVLAVGVGLVFMNRKQ